MLIDFDSSVGNVHGYTKEGAAYGNTRTLGYPPLLATGAGSDEVRHVRLRKGSANKQRGVLATTQHEALAGPKRWIEAERSTW